MGIVYLKCQNAACHFHRNLMTWPEGMPSILCPICNSRMEVTKSVGQSTEWLPALAEDENYWVSEAETVYPAVVAYEYRNLRRFCRESQAYAVLLSLKDNFEALLKLEVLLAFAWAAQNGTEVFESQTISQLMTPNPSLGTWLSLASVILKDVRRAGMVMPECIPLDKIRREYERESIVNWRNEKIGHGAMGLSEDSEFREDIREKVEILKKLFNSIDRQLREQELFLPMKENGKSGGRSELILTGADMARGLSVNGNVQFRSKDRRLEFYVDPFIIIRRHEKNGYGIYYFDNQRTRSLTYFLAYAEGSRTRENVGYFERLRGYFESSGMRLESKADDMYLTEDEIREMDVLQMSHGFVNPEHLVRWLKKNVEQHDRGVFLLQMDRGTGKSVFTNKLSGLAERPILIADDLDVRTYHFSRTQTAGSGDIRSGIEWLWVRDHKGKTWARAPHISDFEREGKESGEALCAFLEEIQVFSRRNRRKERILMILDGLDEISEESLWNFIPVKEMLGEGIYFLLTSRNPQTEKLTREIDAHLNQLQVTDRLVVERDGADNICFLKEYVKKSDLSGLTDMEMNSLLTLADHRALQLGLLCKLAENGMRIDELPVSSRLVSVYLDTLGKRYGEKASIRFRELLSILCTLGTYEGLSLGALGAMIGENGVTLNLIGMVRDISPMLKTERGAAGNTYTIANSDFIEELEKQIPETEDTVRWIVNLAMSVMRDGNLDKEKDLEVIAAHISDLAVKKLPEGIEALGSDSKEVLTRNAMLATNRITDFRSRERVLDYWNQAYVCFKETLGDEYPYTLTLQSYIATYLNELGRYQDALTILREVCEKSNKVIGEDHPDALATQSTMAASLLELGRYEEALDILKAVCEKRKKVLGENHADTLATQINLAKTLVELGNYEEGLAINQEVYEKRKKLLGENHADTLVSKIAISYALTFLGRHEEALKILLEVFEKKKRLLGPDHTDTLMALNMAATLFTKFGRYEEALEVGRYVYEKLKKTQGEDSLEVLTSQIMIAGTLDKLGRYEESLSMYKDEFEKRKKLIGENHPQTLTAQINAASILIKLERYEEALALQKNAYEKIRVVLGEDHPLMLTVQEKMATALWGLERYEEELPLEREVYKKKVKLLGNAHPETLDTLNIIAFILRKLGRYEEALTAQKEVLVFRSQTLGTENRDTLRALLEVASILTDLERYEESLGYYQTVYEAMKRVLGETDTLTLSALNDLAWTQDKLGHYHEAINNQYQLVILRIRTLGEKDHRTLRSFVRLAEIQLHSGDKKEAANTAVLAETLINQSGVEDEALMERVRTVILDAYL